MEILGLVMLILGTIACIYAYYKIKHQKKIDSETEKTNLEIKKDMHRLEINRSNIIRSLKLLEEQEKTQQDRIKELSQMVEDMNKNANSAFEQYVETLEHSYNQIEREFENSIETLDISYASVQDQYLSKIDSVKADLDKITRTRAAAIEAQLNEERIKKEKEFYSIYDKPSICNNMKLNSLLDIYYALKNPKAKKYYEDAIEITKSLKKGNILIGSGLLSSRDVLLIYLGASNDAHNIYLQILAELGIIGIVLFALTIIMMFIRIIKTKLNKENEKYILITIYFMIVFLMYGITGNGLFDLTIATMYYLMLGLLFSNIKKEKEEKDESRNFNIS